MSSGPYMIGLDGGTEGLRVGIFDERGTPLVFVRNEYQTNFVQPGWAEQNPEDWWNAAVIGIKSALAQIGADSRDIASISVGATSCTLVCLDAAGRVLRPAIIWMDVRAEEEAEFIANSGSPSLRLSGQTHASAEWLPSKALWLSRHQPQIYNETSWLAEYCDYLTWRLTGEKVASQNSAAIRAYYDVENGGWDDDLYSLLGMPDLIDKLPTTVLSMGSKIGSLSKSAQQELGLGDNVAVVVGGADAFVGQVGLGVVNPGAMALITGSSHLLILQTENRVHGEGTWGGYPSAVIDGQYTVEGGQTSSGSMIGWFKRLVQGDEVEANFFDTLTPLAQDLPPGSDGLIVLDHFQGNRTPYVDAASRGAILGLSLSHKREHIFRAMIESVCFGSENTMRQFKAQGHQINRVVASGGATNSELWLKLHADISNVPIEVTKVPEAASLGPAILGAVGAGIYGSIAEAVEQMVHEDRVITPDAQIHAEYEPFFLAYQSAYQNLRPILHQMAGMQSSARRVR
jgi:ribulokinase